MYKLKSQVQKGKFPHLSSHLNLKWVPQEHLSTHHHRLPSCFSAFSFLEWLRCEEMAQIKFRAIWHENPFWACRKNIKKMVKFYLAFFFFFSSILRRKSILWECWFYRNISRNCLKETEHIMHRTFPRHSQIYNIFNYKTQRDKKQEVCAKNSPFCSTNWQWKRLRE